MTRAAPWRQTFTTGAALAFTALAGVGCDRTNSTTATPPNTGTGATGGTGADMGRQVTGPARNLTGPGSNLGAGGAPEFGQASGTGFGTGDAANNTGTGSGLMGFHGTGAMGTSAAISDRHDAGKPPTGVPEPVLPEQ